MSGPRLSRHGRMTRVGWRNLHLPPGGPSSLQLRATVQHTCAMAVAFWPPFITMAVVECGAKAASSGQTPGPKCTSLLERPQ